MERNLLFLFWENDKILLLISLLTYLFIYSNNYNSRESQHHINKQITQLNPVTTDLNKIKHINFTSGKQNHVVHVVTWAIGLGNAAPLHDLSRSSHTAQLHWQKAKRARKFPLSSHFIVSLIKVPYGGLISQGYSGYKVDASHISPSSQLNRLVWCQSVK